MPLFIDMAETMGPLDTDSIPMQRVLIKAPEDQSKMSALYADLVNQLKYSSSINIFDFRDFQETLEDSQQILSIIFTIISMIAMFLCFFSLISSMTANILEQTKEICVLRAVGITKARMCRLYIYEAFVLVISASFSGIIIGFMISWTMIA